MAWTSPMTFTASVLTAAQLNTYLRDNLNETAPAKATAAGQIFVSTGVNAIAARTPAQQYIITSESTTSLTYANLATVGPAVTVVTGTSALVAVTARMENSTGTAQSVMSYAVSGATTIAADDYGSAWFQSDSASQRARISAFNLETGLTPGSNTFTAKYRAGSNTATFVHRTITVIPL